ncbi:hypothetical protein AC578_6820 [Pseudocercospora eumusae]|uniref:Ankyrin 2,3/unc44 n=1 Tax=Pseudocercospora eumusae TaxID=321146 RepID=A0A139H4M1_9PEZI|nr:hypothetical protein AC578_6820 [Pseudocercospora eumusae]
MHEYSADARSPQRRGTSGHSVHLHVQASCVTFIRTTQSSSITHDICPPQYSGIDNICPTQSSGIRDTCPPQSASIDTCPPHSSSIEPMIATPKPSARDIASYGEEELGRYLEENGRIVSVVDPENISPDFIQRLRDMAQREYGLAKPHPIDLDQLAARLQAVSAERERSDRSPSPASTEPLPPQEELDLEDLQNERRSYSELLNAGGRPPYPPHLLEDIFWHPETFLDHEQYADIIFFYREHSLHSPERTCFCGRHLSRWRLFRRAQRIIRDRNVANEATLRHASSWDNWEAFEDRYGPQEGAWGFSDYTQSVSRRLRKYGFSRPFQLERDLDRQDELTTWIEYLGYEYSFFDAAASYIQAFQQRHDKEWSKLVESRVLDPDDTYESICNIDTAFRRASERERAERDVESAAAALSSTERAISKSSRAQPALRKRLLADRIFFATMKERHKTIKARNEAVTAFLQKIRRYRCEKDEANRYQCLIRWIEKQIPVIELELDHLSRTEDGRDQTGHPRGRKRARSVESDEAQSRKRTRTGGSMQSLSAEKASLAPPRPSCDMAKHETPCTIDDRQAPDHVQTDESSPCSKYNTSATASALMPATRATGALKRCNASPNQTIGMSRPLRRSPRIAGKRERPMVTAAGALERVHASSSKTVGISRPLRRSPRIAGKRETHAMNAPARAPLLLRAWKQKCHATCAKRLRRRWDGKREDLGEVVVL